MRIALFSDTFYPQVNGVSLTLQRLVKHFEHRRGFLPEGGDRLWRFLLSKGLAEQMERMARQFGMEYISMGRPFIHSELIGHQSSSAVSPKQRY